MLEEMESSEPTLCCNINKVEYKYFFRYLLSENHYVVI